MDPESFDGWTILHTKGEGEEQEGYAIGPFPSFRSAEWFSVHGPCECDKTIVGTMFPPGIVMNIVMPEDIEAIFAEHEKHNPEPELMN